jgi:haloacetate dehalogenase
VAGALDHPDAVSRLDVLDIVPTRTIYATLDKARATTVWRYLFRVQPHDLPERLIGSDPGFYLRWTLQEWSGTPGAITAEAEAEYERCFDAATIQATCEDYRAGAGIDLVHDEADADLQLARAGPDFRGQALDCGHFLPEERPRETAERLLDFFR